MGEVTPGLADLLAVLAAVVTRAPAVGDTSGGAHPGAGHQGPPRQHLDTGQHCVHVVCIKIFIPDLAAPAESPLVSAPQVAAQGTEHGAGGGLPELATRPPCPPGARPAPL